MRRCGAPPFSLIRSPILTESHRARRTDSLMSIPFWGDENSFAPICLTCPTHPTEGSPRCRAHLLQRPTPSPHRWASALGEAWCPPSPKTRLPLTGGGANHSCLRGRCPRSSSWNFRLLPLATLYEAAIASGRRLETEAGSGGTLETGRPPQSAARLLHSPHPFRRVHATSFPREAPPRHLQSPRATPGRTV